MKTRLTASLTLGACLLLPTAGVVLAANPHPFTITGKGQPGTNNGISCGGNNIVTGAPIAAAPGNGNGSAANAANSPFGSNPPNYAGQGTNPTVDKSVASHPIASQYDVACFQAP